MFCNQNIAAGIIGLIISVTAWAVSNSFPQMPGNDLGADFYPKVIAVCLGLVSFILLVSGALTLGRGEKGQTLSGLALLKFVLLILVLGLYAFCITKLGYFVSTVMVSLLTTFIAYWNIDAKKILYSCINSAFICVSIYCVFQLLFKFSLPRGIFF